MGNGKTVTFAGYTISNTDAANYILTQPANSTANIIQAALTVTANAVSNVYGDTLGALTYTTSGLLGSDSLSGAMAVTNGIGGSATAGTVLSHQNNFDVAGSPFTITQGTLADANYAITYNGANLTLAAKALSDTGFAVSGRTYDGLTDATITSNGALTSGGSTSGDGEYVTGDTVSIAGGGTATFGSKNAGSETATGSLSLAGTQAADYTLTAPTATAAIAREALTVTAQADTKTYDGTTTSTVIPTITSGAIMTGDTAGFSETYSSKNAGSGLTLTPSGIVSDGTAGNNYSYTFDSAGTGVINPKDLTVTANNKTITVGSPDPALTYSYTGLAGGDSSASFTGALARTPGETAGTYSIFRNTLAATGNYTIGTFNNGVFTINTAATNTPVSPKLPPTVLNITPVITPSGNFTNSGFGTGAGFHDDTPASLPLCNGTGGSATYELLCKPNDIDMQGAENDTDNEFLTAPL